MRMPREARRKSSTKVYHIILRGINQQVIFEDEEDAYMFLHLLKFYKEKSGYQIYAYCLMGNHLHILIKEGEEPLGIVMRRIGARFVYWYNSKYDRCGHLFQDRFKSEAVEDCSYLLNVLRYIHQNPLKAGLAKNVADFKWSSYSEYLNQSRIVDRDYILQIIHPDQKTALSFFIEFHQIPSEDDFLDFSEKKRITDQEAAGIIKKICNVAHCVDIQKIEDKDKRNYYLCTLKNQGLSTRQIARLTGISRGTVIKAKN